MPWETGLCEPARPAKPARLRRRLRPPASRPVNAGEPIIVDVLDTTQPDPPDVADAPLITAGAKFDALTIVDLDRGAAARGITRSEAVREAVTVWIRNENVRQAHEAFVPTRTYY